MMLAFTELPCPEDVFSIRLADRAGSPVLLAASMIDGVPHACEPGGTPFRLGPAPMSVYASWDARHLDGAWETIVTVAGSSLCDLAFRDRRGELSTRDLGVRPVYQNPRFVRDATRPWQATAIRDDRLVLLERDPADRLAVRLLLEPPPKGDFQDAVITRDGSHVLLTHLSYFQGSVRPDREGGMPHRTLWRYETAKLSTVVGVALDASWSPISTPVRPFGDALVFQMDAAPVGDGRVAVFATTQDGWRLAIGSSVSEGTVPGAELVSPTILAGGGVLHLAAIASRPEGRVIVRAQSPPE